MTDESEFLGPAAAEKSVNGEGESFRSQQKTLAMGGNVNQRERMPSLLEIAEELVESGPPPSVKPKPEPEAGRLTDVALRAISEAPPPAPAADATAAPVMAQPAPSRPPPSIAPAVAQLAVSPTTEAVSPTPPALSPTPPPATALETENAAPSLTDFWRRDSRPTSPGSPGSFDLDALALSVAPEPGPETFTAQLKDPGADAPARDSSTGAALERLSRGWSPLNGRYRWASLGAITVLALGGGFWFGSGHEHPAAKPSVQHASNPVPDDAEDPGASPAALAPSKGGPAAADEGAKPGDAAHAVGTASTAAEQAPVAEDGERDPHFAVRQPKKAESCDDVLGHPFEVQPEPNAGKSGAFWSRSRRSLMHGQSARAVEQMCLSASWDLSGRGTFGLSEHYFREADFDQALAWAKRVPEGSKRYADARTMLGDIYSQQGRVEEALAAYLGYWNIHADALDKRADLAVRFGNSAAMARRKGDWWTAERFYRRALVLDSDYALAASGLARVYAHFELHDATVYWAERALSLNEKDATQAAMALCTTWIHEKNRAEAEKALDTLRRIAPNHPIIKSFARQISRL